ncbi:hypothetical protein A8B78_16895 [Jannaschia sp. EhC01]|nr:hypothetical protein A8B78_16895 [Jannaschia sp. EhC01]
MLQMMARNEFYIYSYVQRDALALIHKIVIPDDIPMVPTVLKFAMEFSFQDDPWTPFIHHQFISSICGFSSSDSSAVRCVG